MRTTLRLDDELAHQLKQKAHREQRSFKQVVNEVIRAGLGSTGKSRCPTRRFAIKTFKSKLKVGIDEAKLNQIHDQLEAEHFLKKTVKP